MRTRHHAIALLVFLSACSSVSSAKEWCPVVSAQDGNDTKLRVLFIGNSYVYVNNLDVVLRNMASSRQSGAKLYTERIAEGGATLQEHCSNPRTAARITDGKWDFVVLQEQSVMPVADPNTFYRYATKLDAVIRKSGAKTAFFMTWARRGRPQMTDYLDDSYTHIGRDLGAIVAPVGLAWAMSLNTDASVSLYMEDGSHPNERGTYLTACVLYATLTGRSPVGLSNGGLASITAAQATYLQNIAWSAVDKYKTDCTQTQSKSTVKK
jgi:hypothetical protein